MTAIVTRGNAMDLHLPDETVDLIVTSPPYFGLRSYQDGGEHYEGQVGDEPTFDGYLDNLIACTREWARVLKPSGSLAVNIGDKYGPNKTLLGLPWRYAIRCIDDLGLILRAEIVWSKPNGLPESVTDRVRRSHEQVFHFVKQPRYYSAVDEVREGLSDWSSNALNGRWKRRVDPHEQGRYDAGEKTLTVNPLGKLPGSVWTIPTAPLKVPASLGIDHFAAYPPELVRRIVLGWSPREVCTACGEGRRPVVDRPSPVGAVGESIRQHDGANGQNATGSTSRLRLSGGPAQRWKAANPDTLTGYACACPDTTAPATPGVVLDPFGGTGTTALVASAHGRVGISVDLSADYCRLARWRTTDPGERARVLGVAKPEPVPVGQLGLFEGGAA